MLFRLIRPMARVGSVRPNPLEPPRLDADAANFRLTIITSFLLGATMISLSLNVSIIRQSAATGLMGTTEWCWPCRCADAPLHAYHALHVLRDSGCDVPCP